MISIEAIYQNMVQRCNEVVEASRSGGFWDLAARTGRTNPAWKLGRGDVRAAWRTLGHEACRCGEPAGAAAALKVVFVVVCLCCFSLGREGGDGFLLLP